MIDRLQQHLSDIYQVGGVHDVRDYLITDPRLAQCIGAGSMLSDTSETLLLSQDEEGLALSLFLDGELLSRLESADPLNRLRTELRSCMKNRRSRLYLLIFDSGVSSRNATLESATASVRENALRFW